MRKTKTLAILVVTIVCALAFGGYAYAHALGFESDLLEDGAVNVCNPEGVQAPRVAIAIEEWNAATARWNRPTLRDVSNSGEFCELEVARQGGDQATSTRRPTTPASCSRATRMHCRSVNASRISLTLASREA